MRVLMSADTLGGVFTHALDLAGALARADVEVAIVTFGRSMSRDQRRRAAAAGIEAVHDTGLALEWMDDPWRDVRAGAQTLRELEACGEPDVVHLNAFAHGDAGFRAPVVVAGHSCVCSWWMAVHGEAPPPEWGRYRDAVRRGLSAADAVVAPSRTMLDALAHWYGPLPERALTIPNGSGYAGPAHPAAKEPLVLTAGRLWDEAKNVAALRRIAARDGLRDRVLLAGEGEAQAEGVVALGFLAPAELARVRRRAAVYAAPARYEPFGLAILEAARDHCALVLGDIPSLREIWDGAAEFVAPVDDERLAAVLQRLLSAPAAAAALGERAWARAQAQAYSPAAMGDAYRRLYADLVADRERMAA